MCSVAVQAAIIGAGPAGLAASVELARCGVERPWLIDEAPVAGGRMRAQAHPDPRRPGSWWLGERTIEEMAQQAARLGVQMQMRTEVWGLFEREPWRLMLSSGAEKAGISLDAEAVLVATGAAQHGLPFPGWTLPGVLAAGAVHTMLHGHAILPGRRILIVGCDPLALSLASELPEFGVEVLGVVLPPPGPTSGSLAEPQAALERLGELAHLAPTSALRVAGSLAARASRMGAALFPRRGVRLGDVPLWLRRCILEAHGVDGGLRALVTDLALDGLPVESAAEELDVDAIVVSGGLYPLTELLEATAAAEFAFVDDLAGSVPLHGHTMQTTAAGLFVAGSACGVEGSAVAIAQGRLAGIGMAYQIGALGAGEAETRIAEARGALTTARRNALISFVPHAERGHEHVEACWRQRQRV